MSPAPPPLRSAARPPPRGGRPPRRAPPVVARPARTVSPGRGCCRSTAPRRPAPARADRAAALGRPARAGGRGGGSGLRGREDAGEEREAQTVPAAGLRAAHRAAAGPAGVHGRRTRHSGDRRRSRLHQPLGCPAPAKAGDLGVPPTPSRQWGSAHNHSGHAAEHEFWQQDSPPLSLRERSHDGCLATHLLEESRRGHRGGRATITRSAADVTWRGPALRLVRRSVRRRLRSGQAPGRYGKGQRDDVDRR